jgi:hypothetical protein
MYVVIMQTFAEHVGHNMGIVSVHFYLFLRQSQIPIYASKLPQMIHFVHG